MCIRDRAGIDATLHEVALRCGGTTLTEGQVVLIRAALVCVAFNSDTHAWVRSEPRELLVESGCCIRTNVILVEVEVDRSCDGARVDCHWCWRCCRCYAGRISLENSTKSRVRAHCRRRSRRRRCDALRARSRNVLESSIGAHCFTTCLLYT